MAWQGMACMRPLIIISGEEHREHPIRRSPPRISSLQIQVTVACNLVGWY